MSLPRSGFKPDTQHSWLFFFTLADDHPLPRLHFPFMKNFVCSRITRPPIYVLKWCTVSPNLFLEILVRRCWKNIALFVKSQNFIINISFQDCSASLPATKRSRLFQKVEDYFRTHSHYNLWSTDDAVDGETSSARPLLFLTSCLGNPSLPPVRTNESLMFC